MVDSIETTRDCGQRPNHRPKRSQAMVMNLPPLLRFWLGQASNFAFAGDRLNAAVLAMMNVSARSGSRSDGVLVKGAMDGLQQLPPTGEKSHQSHEAASG